ncbi:hypothetical protein FQN55_001195 [Onygenales sp. PD_40]|nr:hypothetical protein FQN55_001195 [Onygenales sp. PD_40]KAK2786602.1 hypothetical protein FQN52_007778 [Onygenales sp. PD_12]KAK2807382.1 hypothetical protein FQN51_003208 [Onygenales sp. PD_10]
MTLPSSPLASLSATSASYLESLAPRLPASLGSLVSRFAISLSSSSPAITTIPWLDSLSSSLAALPFLASPARLAVTLLAFFLAVLAMSWNPWRGRPFPFSTSSPTPPTVNDDDYSYVTVDDADYTRLRNDMSYGSGRRAHPQYDDDESEPDRIVLKHRGKKYPLTFPAYSIGEGLISVGDVRRAAAESLNVPHLKQIKILYKGKLLNDDTARAKDVGLKQNSSPMLVISEFIPDSSSEESLLTPPQNDRYEAPEAERSPPPQTTSGGRRKRRHKKRSNNNNPNPNEAQSSPIPDQRQFPPSSFPSRNSNSPNPSASPMPNPPSTTGAPLRIPTNPPNLNSVRTAQEKLEMLTDYFESTLEPLCRAYIANPPLDPKTRDFEHRKLTETTMMHVILKVDGIDVDGDEQARQHRRALIVRVQGVLKEVDEAAKN